MAGGEALRVGARTEGARVSAARRRSRRRHKAALQGKVAWLRGVAGHLASRGHGPLIEAVALACGETVWGPLADGYCDMVHLPKADEKERALTRSAPPAV